MAGINGFEEKQFKLTKGESIALAGIMEAFMALREKEAVVNG